MDGHESDQLQAATTALLTGVLQLQLAERRVESRIAAQFGLSQSDVLALALLVRNRDQTIGRIAATLDLNPGSTSTLVRRLTTAGLVERVPNPDDGRSVIIAVTPLGSRTVDTVREQYATAIRAAADAVTPDCIHTTAKVLTGTAHHLDQQAASLKIAS